jgi:ABC-type glycerol-3-phosphate transport system substrate-binding protein
VSRAVRFLLALVGALLLAGCGGGSETAASGPPQTKAEYQATVGEIVADVNAKYGNLSVDPAKLAADEVADVQTGLRELADELDEVRPPDEVSALHAEYVAGLRGFADELPDLTEKLKAATDDPSAGLDVLLDSEPLQQLLRASQGFGEKGYDLDLAGS